MDIERAVDDFVRRGKDLFHQLRSEGESLSSLARHTLRAQLHVLRVEAERLEHRLKSGKRKTPDTCEHQRLIDDYIDAQGQPTGHVCCLECGANFKDPLRRSET